MIKLSKIWSSNFNSLGFIKNTKPAELIRRIKNKN